MAEAYVTYPALAGRVRALPPSCGATRVVAIDGPSGSGKSLLARLLAGRLASGSGEVPVVGADAFPVPWDGHPLAWWEPMARQVLVPLAAGRPGAYRPYDWRRGAYTGRVEVPPCAVLVIEGVGAAWRGAPAALRIWVEAPRALRRRRVVERDGPDVAARWDRWTRAEDAHFRADGTRGRADLRVDGAGPMPSGGGAGIRLLTGDGPPRRD